MEPVPEVVRQAALQAFDLRVPDAELAELIYDPLLDADGSQLHGGERVLHFSTGQDSVMVGVTHLQSGLRLTVALVPPSTARVELRNPTDSWHLVANELGRLCVDSVPSGPVSLVIRREGVRPIQTSWVRI